jgi:hypothetical protein
LILILQSESKREVEDETPGVFVSKKAIIREPEVETVYGLF